MGVNHLGKEKSPYLLQHKDNPVHWYAWGEEAFAAARNQNKIIFLSIGYSTCHWCHVMEHDSFEKGDVAKMLNDNFISIKVDREERPDVDQIYMDAVVAISGRGGWPMSVFLTPDLKPIYGGTFYWRPQFLQLLREFNQAWQENPAKFSNGADVLTKHLAAQSEVNASAEYSEEFIKNTYDHYKNVFDSNYGGFGPAPKFPPSQVLRFLLRVYTRSQNKKALQMVTTTLDAMAKGGMYDHVGGGFSRYSTDTMWMTPHFEKMLYDNALLATTYLEAFQVTKNQQYKNVAQDILDYILRDMTSPKGGFYSAEDADSEGEEGKFYVWKMSELQNILNDEELKEMRRVFMISEEGNFENQTNILYIPRKNDLSSKYSHIVQTSLNKLFEFRKNRIHPYKDDKILVDWNGLMIEAMAKGSKILEDKKYLRAAQNSTKFIQNKLFANRELLRRYRDGDARITATLNDYAYLISGLLELYSADFDSQWISWAKNLQSIQDAQLWDDDIGGYYFASSDTDLFMRNIELNDGATPSGNAISLLNLQKLFALTTDLSFHNKINKMLKLYAGNAEKYPAAYVSAMIAIDQALTGLKEIAVIGGNTERFREKYAKEWLPYVVAAVGQGSIPTLLNDRVMVNDLTTYYVCEEQICHAPTTSIEDAFRQINQIKRLIIEP